MSKQKILWEGQYYMQASQTITLPEKISAQKTGIILAWSRYDSGDGSREYAWNYTHIPKADVLLHEGTGHTCLMSTTGNPPTIASKYVYVSDDKIAGRDQNKESPQNLYVLRRVIGY